MSHREVHRGIPIRRSVWWIRHKMIGIDDSGIGIWLGLCISKSIGPSMFLLVSLRGMTDEKIRMKLRCSEGDCISLLTILVFIKFRTISTILFLFFGFILQG